MAVYFGLTRSSDEQCILWISTRVLRGSYLLDYSRCERLQAMNDETIATNVEG
jgi:hypothetical protein